MESKSPIAITYLSIVSTHTTRIATIGLIIVVSSLIEPKQSHNDVGQVHSDSGSYVDIFPDLNE